MKWIHLTDLVQWKEAVRLLVPVHTVNFLFPFLRIIQPPIYLWILTGYRDRFPRVMVIFCQSASPTRLGLPYPYPAFANRLNHAEREADRSLPSRWPKFECLAVRIHGSLE